MDFTYLIVGGGMAAAAAVKGIREVDPGGNIGLVSGDIDPPYSRPPLSKGLWKGRPVEKIWLLKDERGLSMFLGRWVTSLEPGAKHITDDQGQTHRYEKLLLATGGTPRKLPIPAEGVIFYRTFRDYQRLNSMTETQGRFAVIGGGFIGSELAAALTMNGKQAVMIYPEAGIGWKVFPPEISHYLNDYYRAKGVEINPGELVSRIEKSSQGFNLTLKNAATGEERRIRVGAVVAGIGVQPNVELAQKSGLKVEDGIWVDDSLHTSEADIFTAGDAAFFYNPSLGKRIRVEHEDNALSMGKMAGQNMALDHLGKEPHLYHYLPYFYSDLFEIGYEAVGEVDSRHETFFDWQDPYKKGVVYYLNNGRVVGVLLWNVWDRVPAARELIAEEGPFTGEELRGRIT